MHVPFSNNMLYTWFELARHSLLPSRFFAQVQHSFYKEFCNYNRTGRAISAGYELFERITRHYDKPEFGIKRTLVDGVEVNIKQKVVLKQTFCRLLHFKKDSDIQQPKMLVVAPMSGHYATLLRGTVEGLLPHYDVYITDWKNARDIPAKEGGFHFDDFVRSSIDFIELLGPNLNVMAVCQPSVPVAAAVSIMSKNGHSHVPDTLTLMGGPIDTRKNPTEVNDYAAARNVQWFEQNVITEVPMNYKGAGRMVYPGFMQLGGFMAMNLQNHIEAHTNLFKHLVEGDGDSVFAHKKFYNEYLAVMDLPAEFYLETVDIVFKKHALPRKKLISCGHKVDLSDIKHTALLCIEGERDDISGLGQTKATIKLCDGLADSKKTYYMQKGVGHYGIFNGRRYREQIVPVIHKFTKKHNKPIK